MRDVKETLRKKKPSAATVLGGAADPPSTDTLNFLISTSINRLNAQQKERSPAMGSANMYASGRYHRPYSIGIKDAVFRREEDQDFPPHTPGTQGLGASFAGTSATPRASAGHLRNQEPPQGHLRHQEPPQGHLRDQESPQGDAALPIETRRRVLRQQVLPRSNEPCDCIVCSLTEDEPCTEPVAPRSSPCSSDDKQAPLRGVRD
ncbi:hypothetical protein N7450_011670 [Penicillium hetheringtonii]|uniref:Uncharacterized protein n=1 Tax=Penicillium hetheringtonii TaxID=911720 RepID=A0AAD6DAC0_9EURO|nr:hypothetical protein N7450_011670 [Penicillium hetheringtonii]